MVSETKNQNTDSYLLELHALDLTTGAEKFHGGFDSATVAGKLGNDGMAMCRWCKLALQRPALLLENGILYSAFGSN